MDPLNTGDIICSSCCFCNIHDPLRRQLPPVVFWAHAIWLVPALHHLFPDSFLLDRHVKFLHEGSESVYQQIRSMVVCPIVSWTSMLWSPTYLLTSSSNSVWTQWIASSAASIFSLVLFKEVTVSFITYFNLFMIGCCQFQSAIWS